MNDDRSYGTCHTASELKAKILSFLQKNANIQLGKYPFHSSRHRESLVPAGRTNSPPVSSPVSPSTQGWLLHTLPHSYLDGTKNT